MLIKPLPILATSIPEFGSGWDSTKPDSYATDFHPKTP